jgi:hypothetical protein
MKTKRELNYLGLIFILIATLSSIYSCQKNDSSEITTDVIISSSSVNNPVIIDTIVQQDYPLHIITGQKEFDWENAEFIPLPSTQNPIPVPWSDRARRNFSEDIRYDYKKEDGWLMYYCSFSDELNPPVKTFMLYNKYRGILRFYYFFTGTGIENVSDYNIFSNDIMSMGSHASMSPILNFAHQNIIDVNKNSTHCVTIEPEILSDSTWFAWEYELAFDKDIYNQDPNTFLLNIGYGMLKKIALSINGIQLDDLNARIRFTDGTYQYGDSYNGNANIIIYGKNDINQMSNILSGSDLTLINQIYDQQSFNNILNGSVNYNYLGEIQWNANLAITTQPNGVGLPGGGQSFVISGANNYVMQGLGSFYNKPLGIFYLNRKPKVSYSKINSRNHQFQYELNVNSVEYIINPSVLDFADIKNISQNLVATENKELIENNSRAKLYIGQKLLSNIELTIQGVRVSFDVVPKNGSKPVHIVKVFQADIETSK